jgi:hypothetical protein
LSIVSLAILLVLGIPIVSFVIVAGLTVAAIQATVALAIFGYLFLGVPWAIYRRIKDGYWPSAD